MSSKPRSPPRPHLDRLTLLPPDPTARHPLSAPARSRRQSTRDRHPRLSTPGVQSSQVRISDHALGKGSFGSVWRGTFSGSPVAIKVCSLSSSSHSKESRAAIQHFRRETARYYHLRHPCIVQFFCVVHDQASNNLQLVTELMKGGSLFSALQSLRLAGASALPSPAMLRIATHIANGLAYLHASSFSFGDLKSMNVLLSETPNMHHLTFSRTTQAKLCDFGLSRNLDRLVPNETHVPARNGPAGTYPYLAPEAFRGISDDPDAAKAADVYALAIVLWELATLSIPWSGRQVFELVRLVCKEGRRPSWPTDHSLPPSFIRLVNSCWQQEPSQRPTAQQAAASLSTMLNAFLDADDARRAASLGPDFLSAYAKPFRRGSLSSLRSKQHAVALALDADLLKDINPIEINSSVSSQGRATSHQESSPVSPIPVDDIADGIADVVVDDIDDADVECDGAEYPLETPSTISSSRVSVDGRDSPLKSEDDGFILPALHQNDDDDDFDDDDDVDYRKISSSASTSHLPRQKQFEIDKNLSRADTPVSLQWGLSWNGSQATADVASMSDVTQQTMVSMESSAPGSASSSAARLRKYTPPSEMSNGLEEEIQELERQTQAHRHEDGFDIFSALTNGYP